MQEILIKAGCFIAIIILGYVLKRVGFFKEEDFKILSKIVLKITLPAAIVVNFAGKTIEPSMLAILFIGLGGGVLYMILGYLINLKKGKEQKAFGLLNLSGYNIGNFTMPFVQSFLGPVGVITASVFDVGNAFVCLGGAYGIADTVRGNGKFSVGRILKALTKSVAFDCYIIMIVLSLLRVELPSPILSFAEIIKDANAFAAMLMIGVGFHLSGEKSQLGSVVKYLLLRYGVAAIIAIASFYWLPFDLEVKKAVMILAFSPVASSVPAFTGEIEGDVGLSSAINSIAIICSIVFIVAILLLV